MHSVMKVYINLRDELAVIDTEMVAYVNANSNYSDIYFIKGGKRTLSMTISKVESLLKQPYSSSNEIPFVRIGRSLLINQKYLVHIDLLKEKLLLSDYDGHSYLLSVSKFSLKKYKDLFFVSRKG